MCVHVWLLVVVCTIVCGVLGDCLCVWLILYMMVVVVSVGLVVCDFTHVCMHNSIVIYMIVYLHNCVVLHGYEHV